MSPVNNEQRRLDSFAAQNVAVIAPRDNQAPNIAMSQPQLPQPPANGRGPSPVSALDNRRVVAVVVECHGSIALLKRSRNVRHDSGLWHCVTGFIEHDTPPEQQALEELFEECHLEAGDLLTLRRGPSLVLPDAVGKGKPWLVHTFTAITVRRRLRINWEHESYCWTRPHKVRRFSNRVSWLETILEATGHLKTSPRQG
jgi:8-oxo-dGTP pyrophosphatase MutT (NUDIX family)